MIGKVKGGVKMNAVLAKVGSKLSQVVSIFSHQGTLHTNVSSNAKTPNADTASAIKELKNGGGTHYKNSQEMYDDLQI